MQEDELEEILEPIQRNQQVQMMKQYIQHGKTSTFKHCRNVAETCDQLNERFRLGADRRTLIISAMLHDFYLYDWHCADDGSHRCHGFHHARTARNNAIREFAVSGKIQSAIAESPKAAKPGSYGLRIRSKHSGKCGQNLDNSSKGKNVCQSHSVIMSLS